MGKYTDRNKSWELLNSWWIILAFVPFIGAPIAFFYIASKAKKKAWYYIGFGYILITAALFAGRDAIKDIIGNEYGGLLVALLAVDVVLPFIFRKEYLIRLDMLQKANVDQIATNNLRDKVAADLAKAGIATQNAIDNQVDIQHEFTQSHKEPTPTVPENNSPIDINSCTVEDIANLPGVSLILAKKAVNYRQENNGFKSIEEFYGVVGLKPHFIAQVEGCIVCNTMTGTEKPTNGSQTGRQLDL